MGWIVIFDKGENPGDQWHESDGQSDQKWKEQTENVLIRCARIHMLDMVITQSVGTAFADQPMSKNV